MFHYEKIERSENNTVVSSTNIQNISRKINSNGLRCLAVNDRDGKFIGLIHDTDIRRSLFINKEASVDQVINRDAQAIKVGMPVEGLTKPVIPVLNQDSILSHFLVRPNENELAELCAVRKVGVIGLGYVGATLSIALASQGLDVVGIERDSKIVNSINNGVLHFYETDAEKSLASVIKTGAFSAVTHATDSTLDTVFITVGTPLDENKIPKFSDLNDAFKVALKLLKPGGLICLRSTVVVGTCDRLYREYQSHFVSDNLKSRMYLSMAPERTIEGNALNELMENPQIIGSPSQVAVNKTKAIFEYLGVNCLLTPSFKEAELAKLVDNTWRDYQFAYANMFAILSQNNGINIRRVFAMANFQYERTNVPMPSPGVGGPCLTKDTHILVHGFQCSQELSLLTAARHMNEVIVDQFIANMIDRVQLLNGDEEIKEIHVLGLAFKGEPQTGDLRDSPALRAVRLIKERNIIVKGFDPNVAHTDPALPCPLIYEEEIGENADAVCILNNNTMFQKLDWEKISNRMSKSYVFDGWGILEKSNHLKCFLIYEVLGGRK